MAQSLDNWLTDKGFYAFKEPLQSKLNISSIEDISKAKLTQNDINDFVDECRKLPNASSLMPFVLCTKFKMQFWIFVQNSKNPSFPTRAGASTKPKKRWGVSKSVSKPTTSNNQKNTLITWVNKHLETYNDPNIQKITNLSKDLRDGKVYTILLHCIAPNVCNIEYLNKSNEKQRCLQILKSAESIGIKPCLKQWNIPAGSEAKNTQFMEQLYNYKPSDNVVNEEKDINHNDLNDNVNDIVNVASDVGKTKLETLVDENKDMEVEQDIISSENAMERDEKSGDNIIGDKNDMSLDVDNKMDDDNTNGMGETPVKSPENEEDMKESGSGSVRDVNGNENDMNNGNDVKSTTKPKGFSDILKNLEKNKFVHGVDPGSKGRTRGFSYTGVGVGRVKGKNSKLGSLIGKLDPTQLGNFGRARARTETAVSSNEMKEVDLNALVMDRPVINQTQGGRRRRKSRNNKILDMDMDEDESTPSLLTVVNESTEYTESTDQQYEPIQETVENNENDETDDIIMGDTTETVDE